MEDEVYCYGPRTRKMSAAEERARKVQMEKKQQAAMKAKMKSGTNSRKHEKREKKKQNKKKKKKKKRKKKKKKMKRGAVSLLLICRLYCFTYVVTGGLCPPPVGRSASDGEEIRGFVSPPVPSRNAAHGYSPVQERRDLSRSMGSETPPSPQSLFGGSSNKPAPPVNYSAKPRTSPAVSPQPQHIRGSPQPYDQRSPPNNTNTQRYHQMPHVIQHQAPHVVQHQKEQPAFERNHSLPGLEREPSFDRKLSLQSLQMKTPDQGNVSPRKPNAPSSPRAAFAAPPPPVAKQYQLVKVPAPQQQEVQYKQVSRQPVKRVQPMKHPTLNIQMKTPQNFNNNNNNDNNRPPAPVGVPNQQANMMMGGGGRAPPPPGRPSKAPTSSVQVVDPNRQLMKFPSFGVSLDSIMGNQQPVFPDEKVPVVYRTMVKLVRDNDGFCSEGIFRLSGEKGEIVRLKDQLQKGVFDLEFRGDPNVPACALKQWVGELKPSIVPANFRERVLAEGYHILPYHHRNLMEALVELIREVMQYAPDNRMTPVALATVFSPGIFGSLHSDPLSFFANSQDETAFMVKMIEQ